MVRKSAWCLAIAVIAVALAAPADAEEQVDIVYLRDGSKLVGLIVEQVPGEQLRLRTSDGSEHIIAMEQVERIVKEWVGPADFSDASYSEIGIAFGTPGGL